jgi:23S rRNA (cytidine1920-2'-O)/16S rRNA (cytidine1409-2'-O)-methyltransferase
MAQSTTDAYVSRSGEKLAAALDHFGVDVTGAVCADLGSHVGGFVDCLLRRGAARVFSIDTAYGILAWKLRRDPRVVVFERTNAMHVVLPEHVGIVTVDVGWTPQAKILPNAARLLSPTGRSRNPRRWVITLIKPHYEAPKVGKAALRMLVDGVLPDDAVDNVVTRVLDEITATGWDVVGTVLSPLRGHGGNREHFALLARS